MADEGWWNGESSVDSIWWVCLGRLQGELASEEFNAWIRPLQPRRSEARLELLAPNRYVRDKVEDVYLLRIAELVAEIDGKAELDGVDLVVGSREREPGTPAGGTAAIAGRRSRRRYRRRRWKDAPRG